MWLKRSYGLTLEHDVNIKNLFGNESKIILIVMCKSIYKGLMIGVGHCNTIQKVSGNLQTLAWVFKKYTSLQVRYLNMRCSTWGIWVNGEGQESNRTTWIS